MTKLLGISVFCLGLVTLPASVGFNCLPIREPTACDETPGCAWQWAYICKLPKNATPADYETRDRRERELSGCFERQAGR